MVRMLILSLAVVTILAGNAHASIIVLLPDEFDDEALVRSVHEAHAVASMRKQMDKFKERLRQHKEADIVALFGASRPKPEQTFAMPLAQPRCFGMSGLRSADEKMNKDHKEFYEAGTFAGLEVWYGLDGVSPHIILIHCRVDDTFPRFIKDNLHERLRWDVACWQQLEAFYQMRLERIQGSKPGFVGPVRPWSIPSSVPKPAIAAAQCEDWWHDLEAADERRIQRVIAQAAAAGDQTIAMLARAMPPEPHVDGKRLAAHIAALASNRFAERAAAMRALEALHWLAKPALEAALPAQVTLESAMRIRQLLAQMEVSRNPTLRRQQRAVMLLAALDTRAAHDLLRQWAARAPAAFLTQEAAKTLAWLEGRLIP